jgi:hypothetical protein
MCKTGSVTLREEHKLGMSENRVLRTFGAKRDEVTGGWIKLYNENPQNLYCLKNIIRMNKSWRMS